MLNVTNSTDVSQSNGSNLQPLGSTNQNSTYSQNQQDQIAALLRADADNSYSPKNKLKGGGIEQAIIIIGIAVVAVVVLAVYQRVALNYLKKRK